MTVGTLEIGGRKFRIVPEKDYRVFLAAKRFQERLVKEEAADLAEAERRVKDPKRKTIPLSQLKAKLRL